ncbi:MAG: hypothetical protein AB1793_09390 [Candidatus Thermoplasmatota archaeon]
MVELPPEIAERLELAHYDRDILEEMSKEEILKHFGWRTTENVELGRFFRNVIWQFYERIRAGNPPEFYYKRGFIRGMWYDIKTPMNNRGFKQFREDRSGTMGTALAKLVEAGLVSYKDFQFTDDNQEARVIGEGNPHVILMTEKEGFFGMLKVASARYGCTVVATGGMCPFLSTNYMVSEIAAKGVEIAEQEFAVLSICDFDPTGYNIGEEFTRDLRNSGVRRFRRFEQYGRKDYIWLDLIRPSTLEPGEDVYDHTYTVHRRFTKIPKGGGDPWAQVWARTTGGVDGKGGQGKKWKLGIQADEYREAYLSQLLDRFIQPLLRVPAGVVQRRQQMKDLEGTLGNYLIHRMTHPAIPPMTSA